MAETSKATVGDTPKADTSDGAKAGAGKTSRVSIKWIILSAVAVLAVAFIGFRWWQEKQTALPAGIASGNGRIEGQLVDIAAREPLRVKKILVDEGDLVKPGQLLVQMDTVTLDANLAEANAAVVAAEERLALANANITKAKSEVALAAVEADRSRRLVQDGAGSQRELDVRNTKVQTSRASQAEAEAQLATAKQQVQVARANAAVIQTRIDDATLKSPVTGRVLYRLAQPGEVLGPGGKALTLVNLEDIYMEIFLPAEEAARMKLGAEGRITVDYDPNRAVAGFVSFVSPEAQFTPKYVETKSEREKLMFRVKVQVPKAISNQYVQAIKTGVRGVGYVKVNESAVWPPWLQNLVQAPGSEKPGSTKGDSGVTTPGVGGSSN